MTAFKIGDRVIIPQTGNHGGKVGVISRLETTTTDIAEYVHADIQVGPFTVASVPVELLERATHGEKEENR